MGVFVGVIVGVSVGVFVGVIVGVLVAVLVGVTVAVSVEVKVGNTVTTTLAVLQKGMDVTTPSSPQTSQLQDEFSAALLNLVKWHVLAKMLGRLFPVKV